jgi:subtilisin family serine protease
MKRYIVDKKALDLLLISSLDAMTELAKEKVITDEPLVYKHLGFISVVLTEEQVKLLTENGFNPTEEEILHNACLAGDYEKTRSAFYKARKRALTGAGVKIGVLDSGCATAFVPCEFTVNFIDASPFQDVFGHGTRVASIIKHPEIGLAPACTMYGIKVVNDAGTIIESAVLAGLDYAIDQELDVINISFSSGSTNMQTAVADVIAAGVVICAASGNDFVDSITASPATFPEVIAVNAIQENGEPLYRNITPNPSVPGSHGITVACSGVGCQCVNKDGVVISDFGTSFSSPFFVGVFAIYKEMLGLSVGNNRVLNYVLSRAKKTTYPLYFGAGTPSF